MSAAAEESLELREVLGPTAFGTTRKRFWELLWLSSKTDFRMRYINAVLGYFWALMRPLLSFGIIFLFLRQILGFGGKIPNFAPMLMINIILFQYFQETTTQGMRALASKETLVRKMRFPRMVIPLTTSLTASITLGLNLTVGMVLLLAFGLTPSLHWLAIPLAGVALIILSTGIALILSVAFVRLPDVGQLWQVISRVMFYGTPILYTIDLVPSSVRHIVLLNPLTPVFVELRKAVFDPSAPSMVTAAGGVGKALIPVAFGILICVFSLWYFVREAPAVAEAL
jgi:ABC-2 type transport system permease protein